jgi:NADH-quinone oxidoreductase subunit C
MAPVHTQQVSARNQAMAGSLRDYFADRISSCSLDYNEITLVVPRENLLDVASSLVERSEFSFKQLVDLCGVDYLEYGQVEWETDKASGSGFSRGVDEEHAAARTWAGERYAVVYHLLSHKHNTRLRVKTFADDEIPVVDSVIGIWPAADWFEREAFDLFGIMFEGHPDLRRILTDYGFIGHPFRKDFPLIGQVEMRYDTEKRRVVYQPVSIDPRVLVPRVIRDDSRYTEGVVREAEEQGEE